MLPSVVLLNPPGTRPWLRDGYCSLEGRWSTRFFPMDLLVQSALLRGRARVTVVEAIGARLDAEAALEAVVAARPALVLALVGSVSIHEDAAFLARVKAALPGCRILVSGDVTQFENNGLESVPAADGALLDFAAAGILDEHCPAVHRRGHPRPVVPRPARFAYGVPDYAAFPVHSYTLPYAPGPVGSPLSTYGCSFSCRFCNTGAVPWKVREPGDLAEELRWLDRQGVRHHYIRDATFGADREHREQVLRVLRDLPGRPRWNTFTRIDLFDRADLRSMAAAGCAVLQVGLELPDEQVLKSLHKPLQLGRIRERIAEARAAGIEVCGHFLLGVPGAAHVPLAAVVDYAVALGCTFASFNVAAPRPGAPFRGDSGFLPPAEAATQQARAMRRFYTHPRVAARQLRRLRRPAVAAHALRLASSLLRPGS
jgi:hypothetical protein